MKRWMLGVAGILLVWALPAGAQPYPSKPITLIVPYPAGGIADTTGRAVAKELGASPSQVALAWMLNKPHITAPIIGASKMDHLDQAIAALEIQLSVEEIKSLEEPYQPHPILGHN